MVDIKKNPNPTKDQHFMVDKEMLELIYDTAEIEEGESIVEIGGGEGALTDYLIQGNNHITVIEKDPYYASYLKEKYKDYPNVQVIEGDALQFDYSGYDRIVANLPYTITEPFLVNLAVSGALDYSKNGTSNTNVKSITLVLSQNSVRKMVAPVQITEGKSKHINQEFGIMGAICHTFCDVDIVSAIPAESFFPEPAVTSFVVNLTPKKEKTTVDRIMSELLIDKKNNHSAIGRIYKLMLAQNKIYKLGKHKGNGFGTMSSHFTSSVIEGKNIYELNNSQISQLVQDLVRNDVNIKSKNSHQNRRNTHDINDYSRYFVNGHFSYDPEEDFDDEYDDEYTDDTHTKSKFMKKYDYLYDSKKYDVLLTRGLEHRDRSELRVALGETPLPKAAVKKKVV